MRMYWMMNQMLKIQKKSDENVLDDESDVEDSEEVR